jgi:hypothetical protein
MKKYSLNTLNLRDLQEAIEGGEYSTFPAKEWIDEHEANPVNKAAMFICPYDGTIYRTPGTCPNPYHPHPKPRPSNRIFKWLIWIPAVIAFSYSLLNNEALVNLIATAILLVITAIVFTMLLGGIIYVWAKISPESVVRGIRFASHFIALLSAFFAMLIVAVIQKQFPPLIWWVIEFVVAFVLENQVTGLVARFVFRLLLPDLEFPEPDISLQNVVQECLNHILPGKSYRFSFFASCLALGIWFFGPALFARHLPPIWMIPIFLFPYVAWLWKSYEIFFNLIQRPELLKLIREDPDTALRVDVLTTSIRAIIRPTALERRNNWWQMLLFYFSLLLPPGGLVATIIVLEL